MTTLATASLSSTAPPAAFFARWADMASWSEWNSDTEWVRLDGDFVEGATGALKPKGGPKVTFVVERLGARSGVRRRVQIVWCPADLRSLSSADARTEAVTWR